MTLNDGLILKAIKSGHIKIEPFDETLIQPASIDIRLGTKFRFFCAGEGSHLVSKHDSFYIQPGEFILGCSLEKISLPNDILGRMDGKSSLGRKGLMIHSTAGYIDPGFSGVVTLEISNINRSPIMLTPNMKIAQISFMELKEPAIYPYSSEKLGSHYQNQEGPWL